MAAEDVYICPAGQRLTYFFTTEDKAWSYVATGPTPVRVAPGRYSMSSPRLPRTQSWHPRSGLSRSDFVLWPIGTFRGDRLYACGLGCHFLDEPESQLIPKADFGRVRSQVCFFNS